MEERTWVFCTPRISFYKSKEDTLQMVIHASLPDNWAEINAETKSLLSSLGYQLGNDTGLIQAFKKQVGNDWSSCLKYWMTHPHGETAKRKAAWAALSARFGGVVLTAPRVKFRTDYDFTARVSLRSLPYEEQLAFVRDHKAELFDFVCEELNKKHRLLEKIGSLNFYRASCTVTRSSEVEYLFSLKLAAAI